MKMASEIVVEAGGLGYEITVPANSSVYLAHEGEPVTVYTAMMVREDDVSLYGFGDKNELDTFRKLITVSGVGAKAAIAILSAMPLHEVHQAIILEDAKSLTRANGIGKKTAERIVLELKDKVAKPCPLSNFLRLARSLIALSWNLASVFRRLYVSYASSYFLAAISSSPFFHTKNGS